MAQQLAQISIDGPGSQGLNSEISPYQQTAEFALKADNAVIDRIGRLAAREAFADYVSRNNINLGSGETFDLVRIEALRPLERPYEPITKPIPNQPTEYNESEYGLGQWNGDELEVVPTSRLSAGADGLIENTKRNEYGTGEYTVAEYSGRADVNSDGTIIFALAGIGKGKRDEDNVPIYSRYIGCTVTDEGLSVINEIQPTNGLTNCQVVTFKDSILVFSKGDAPTIYTNGSVSKLSDMPDYTPPQDDTSIYVQELDGDIACSAYGRLWVSGAGNDYNTIYYSDLLVPYQWYDGTTTNNGLPADARNTGGIIDVSEYWPNGSDKIQGIAAHNGFLVVFGISSILIYSGAQGDPAGATDANGNFVQGSGLQLEDAIRDVGLVNQDAMCNIGTDLLFVDSLGVRSLGRVIQEKSTPISEPSLNVATIIREDIASNRDTVRLMHLNSKSLVTCLFPSTLESYVFQLGQPGMTGGLRTTKWLDCDFMDSVTVRSPEGNQELLAGRNDRGVTIYYGYSQPVAYQMSYESTTLLGGDVLMRRMVPKSVSFSYKSEEANNLSIQWGFGSNPLPFSKKVKNKPNAPLFTTNKVNLSASGEMLRIGFETTIAGKGFSMQNVSVNTLVGRLIV
jgi:hypothetical protein